jgi:hypothetical protein
MKDENGNTLQGLEAKQKDDMYTTSQKSIDTRMEKKARKTA